ncbi:phosphate/phosphite/phosphonate ABC transporter substrate-binding protein [uncultured Meiothermus sp.]|jgi:phosphonate transport system substrate-binding protein|uniref:phosphate/phosphite/phosphonate ABC transporter substrate-binding protein n=1 Tax=uncultured Meiothermus sp. TaxID=157471 RepID=UPI00263A0B21|nr:phosphate/phosphite/phosphonate ABC transporter substrate-binding protein [uncultured Meiothermus sp.]
MKKLLALAILLIFTSGLAQNNPSGCPAEIRFGILPTEEAAAQARFGSLFQYLERQTGSRFRVTIGADYAAIIIAMANNRLELAWFGPEAYVQAARQTRVVPLVIADNVVSGLSYFSSIYVRADSAFRTLDDLRGRTLAFVDPNSTSGYLIPMVFFVREARVRPEAHFSQVVFAGTHNAGLLSLLNRRVDAAALSSTTVNRAIRQGSLREGELRAIWTSKEIPNSPITASASLSPTCRAAVQRAFLSLRDPGVLTALDARRFVIVADSYYAPVREAGRVREELRRAQNP